MQGICNNFPVTEQEFMVLDDKFGQLCNYAGWQLIKKNTKNNHTEDHEDIAQELRISLIRAGSYYKRQVYIESCLSLCKKYAKGKMLKKVVAQLDNLWNNKTRHGAGKQKFGPHQEFILEQMVQKIVPEKERPSKDAPLVFDNKFNTYCKAITWNAQKSMGKKITKDKGWRTGMVSLSEFDYLGQD